MPTAVDKKPKDNKNVPLIIAISIIAAFYLFMFSSQYIFGHNGYRIDLDAKALGDQTLWIDSWSSAPKAKQMEIVVAIENAYSIMSYDVNLRCMTSTGSEDVPAEIVLQDRDLLVIHASNVPKRYSEVRLTISSSEGAVQFYDNRDDISLLDQITIRSLVGYRIDQRTRQLQHNLDSIDQIMQQIQDYDNDIRDMQAEILEIEGQKKYMTADQMQAASIQIRSIENDIDQIQRQITSLQAEINEYEARNKNLKIEIEDMKKEERQ